MNGSRTAMPAEPVVTGSLSDDGFLDGRLKILQPRKGYRAGLDAVMVAAAVPAKSGERILEAGVGTGVAALCLLSRKHDISVDGIELNPDYAELARKNAARNGFADRLRVVEGDLAAPSNLQPGSAFAVGTYDHAFANPPYRDPSRSRNAPDEARNRALFVTPEALLSWVKFLVAMVRPKGTITLILPGEALEDILSMLQGRAGSVTVFPLFPKPDEAAKRVVIQAIKGLRAPLKVLPGLTLHDEAGAYTRAADAILRGNHALGGVNPH